eukprot:6177400-Pleurochrysis_carterae.AAC.1
MRTRGFLDLELLLPDIDFSSAQQKLQAMDLAFRANGMVVTRFQFTLPPTCVAATQCSHNSSSAPLRSSPISPNIKP